MNQYTNNFKEFNREHPVMDQASADLIAEAFPGAEHLSVKDPGSRPDSSLAGQKNGPKVVALLPAGKTPGVQHALAEALHSLLESESNLAAIDLDISSPRNELLGAENSEGLSDHFLYGISVSKILRDSKQPGLKAITPGTYTPRVEEIYDHPRWKSFLNLLTSDTGRTVVLLGPPMEGLKDLPPLKFADTVVLLSEPLPQGQSPDSLQQIMDTVSRNSAPGTSLRMLWLGELETEPDEPETNETPDEEDEPGEPETAETPEEESEEAESPEVTDEEPKLEEPETPDLEMPDEAKQIDIPELKPLDTLETPEEPTDLESVQAPEETGEEPKPEEPETPDLDMLDETEQIDIPELEPLDTLETPEEPADLTTDQALEKTESAKVTEKEPEIPVSDALEESEQIDIDNLEPLDTIEIPEEPADLETDQSPDMVPEKAIETEDEEQIAVDEPTEDIAEEPAQPENQDIAEEELSASLTKSEEPVPDKPEESIQSPEEEDEILLPDELLFLDEDEQSGEPVKLSDNDQGDEQEVGFNYDELPDLKTMDEQTEELAEISSVPETEEKTNADTGTEQEETPSSQPETLSFSEDELDEFDTDALYTGMDPEDELPPEEPDLSEAEPADDKRSMAAMEKMKSFEETLNAPPEKEVSLALDTDPLAEEESPVEETEVAKPAAEAGDDAPAELEEEALETVEETEVAEPAAEEAADDAPAELEEEALEEVEKTEVEEPAAEEAADDAPAELEEEALEEVEDTAVEEPA
ncbi:hypothetical protein ACFL5K_05590, partial [Gemmatimonadota bacterium]